MPRVLIDTASTPGRAPLALDVERRELQSGTELLTLRLGLALAAAGLQVAVRGHVVPGREGDLELVRPDDRLAPPDVVVGVRRVPPALPSARVRIYLSCEADPPVELADSGCDAVVALSEHHRRLLVGTGLLEHEVVAVPLGVDSAAYPPEPAVERDRFLYAASPDRGLHALLEMWPAIHARFRVPLSIAYDLRTTLERVRGLGHPQARARADRIEHLVDQPGVVVHGPLPRSALVRLQARSIAYLYPYDPLVAGSELFCLSVLESCAAGAVPVLTPRDCLPELYGEVAEIVPSAAGSDWIAAIERAAAPERRAACRAFAARYTWEAFGAAWVRLVTDRLQAPRPRPRPRPRGSGARSLRWRTNDPAGGLARAARARGHDVAPWRAEAEEPCDVLAIDGCDALPPASSVPPTAALVVVERSWSALALAARTRRDVQAFLAPVPAHVWERAEDPRERRVIPVGWLDASRSEGPPREPADRKRTSILILGPRTAALERALGTLLDTRESAVTADDGSWPAPVALLDEPVRQAVDRADVVLATATGTGLFRALARGVPAVLAPSGGPGSPVWADLRALHQAGLGQFWDGPTWALEVAVRAALEDPAAARAQRESAHDAGEGVEGAVRLVERIHHRMVGAPRELTPRRVRSGVA